MFIYENNKSMSKDIRASITETFGFEPFCINSALVSAQNRQRLYWVGVRQPDGTYHRANIAQPEDRGILLKDVLDSAQPLTMDNGKGYALTASYDKASVTDLHRGRNSQAAEPCRLGCFRNGQGYRIYDAEAKSCALTAASSAYSGHGEFYAEPAAACRQVGRRVGEDGHRHDNDKDVPHFQRLEVNDNSQQTNALTTVSKDNLIMEPVRIGTLPRESDGEVTNSRQYRIYRSNGKAVTQAAEAGGMGAKTGLYATQEKPAKEQRVYTVQDGQIEVNGKRYPIKLKDGKYIIRKLTVSECKRLQTVPEWYDFSCVSNTQAYKMLGNGWTVEVIAHLIRGAIKSSIFGC